MECYYLPNPSRTWSRVQNVCTYQTSNNPIISPITGNEISSTEYGHEIAMLNKGNILKYKQNSNQLTQKQRYSRIAQGLGENRVRSWASQSMSGYTNPNTKGLMRVNTINITLDGNQTNLPVTTPPYKPDSVIVIQDLGNLVFPNTCNPIECSLTTSCDVPGKIQKLCWNKRMNLFYPNRRYKMGESSTRLPDTLVSAIHPK